MREGFFVKFSILNSEEALFKSLIDIRLSAVLATLPNAALLLRNLMPIISQFKFETICKVCEFCDHL